MSNYQVRYARYHYSNETGINPNINKHQFWNTSTTGYYQYDPRYANYYNQRYFISAPAYEYPPFHNTDQLIKANSRLVLPYNPALMDR
jgi:hypothetical protein